MVSISNSISIGALAGRGIPAIAAEVEAAGYTEDAVASTDYIAFTAKRQDVTWSDSRTGHIDSILVDGILKYYTASADDEVVVKTPGGGYQTIAPDYFVDSGAAAGGDGRYATPYDALADLPALSSGNVVAIASGSTFAETLTLADNVQVYRYGQGIKPLVDGGETFVNGSFVQHGTYTNMYQQDVTIELHSASSWINVMEDGTFLTRATGLSNCNATPGSYYVSADTGDGDTTITVSVHPTGSTDPTSDGKAYTYTRRLYAINGSLGLGAGQNAIVDGIRTRFQTSSNGSIELGNTGGKLRHSECGDGHKHNALIAAGGHVAGCVFEGAYYGSNSGSLLVAYTEDGAGLDNTIRECALIDTADSSANLGGITSHTGAGGDPFGTTTLSRISVSTLSLGISGIGDTGSAIINDCYFSDTDYAISFSRLASYTVTNCDIVGDVLRGLNFALDGVTAVVDGLGVYCAGSVMAAAIFNQTGNITLTLQNSSLGLDGTTGASRAGCNLQDGDSDITINNCVWNAFNRNYFLRNSPTFASDNNCFNSGTWDINSSVYASLAALQSGEGLDSNSTEGECNLSDIPS